MKYFIRFVGHIIQQPGLKLPHKVYHDVISAFDKEDMDPVETPDGVKMGLKQFCNIMVAHLMEHGMVVPQKPNKMQDGTKIRFDQRMGIPKHVIGKITLIVRVLQEPKRAIPEIEAFDLDGDAPAMPGLTGSVN
jgi:hypothetical protein